MSSTTKKQYGKISICIKVEKTIPKLVLKYGDGIWSKIEQKYKDFGLLLGKSSNAFGTEMECSFYREYQQELKKFLEDRLYACEVGAIDSITTPVFRGDLVNLAIFRVVPTKDEVILPVGKWVDVRDFVKLARVAKVVSESLLNIVSSGEIEVEIEEEHL